MDFGLSEILCPSISTNKSIWGLRKWRPEGSEEAVTHCSTYDAYSHVSTWIPSHKPYPLDLNVYISFWVVYKFGSRHITWNMTKQHEFIEYLSCVQHHFGCLQGKSFHGPVPNYIVPSNSLMRLGLEWVIYICNLQLGIYIFGGGGECQPMHTSLSYM